jgi:hypothetical protein
VSSTHRVISVDSSGKVQSVEEPGTRETRERLSQLAWLLDSSIPIPGTRLTIGIDALIGLFPIIGDLIGVLLSSYILSEAARVGAPKSVLMRMGFNVGLEGLVGMVPFAGDVFDAAFKANQRNVRLLDAWLDQPKKTVRSSRAFGAILILAIALFLLGLIALGFLLIRWIAGLF